MVGFLNAGLPQKHNVECVQKSSEKKNSEAENTNRKIRLTEVERNDKLFSITKCSYV